MNRPVGARLTRANRPRRGGGKRRLPEGFQANSAIFQLFSIDSGPSLQRTWNPCPKATHYCCSTTSPRCSRCGRKGWDRRRHARKSSHPSTGRISPNRKGAEASLGALRQPLSTKSRAPYYRLPHSACRSIAVRARLRRGRRMISARCRSRLPGGTATRARCRPAGGHLPAAQKLVDSPEPNKRLRASAAAGQ